MDCQCQSDGKGHRRLKLDTRYYLPVGCQDFELGKYTITITIDHNISDGSGSVLRLLQNPDIDQAVQVGSRRWSCRCKEEQIAWAHDCNLSG